MSQNPMQAMLARLAGEDDDHDESQPMPSLQAQTRALRLRELQASYSQHYPFKAGDLVQYKPQMQVTRAPRPGEPGIIVEVLPEPIYPVEAGSADGRAVKGGSPLGAERYDIFVGVILGDDNDFVIFPMDSRRFEPFVLDTTLQKHCEEHGFAPVRVTTYAHLQDLITTLEAHHYTGERDDDH